MLISVTPGDQPYILEFSAGNAGPGFADAWTVRPAAKNVIATGASENVPGTFAETYGLYSDGPDTIAIFPVAAPATTGESNRILSRREAGLPRWRPPRRRMKRPSRGR